MTAPKPHFLLFCDGSTPAGSDSAATQRGRWRFVLEDVVSGERTEASDVEQSCTPDRCALISVLRGLESLEEPSRVTLITTSRYVSRGLQYGLTEWRDNDFSWEHFGTVQPIRNADIWRRIDRTLAFHQVQCRWMAQDQATQEDATQELGSLAVEEHPQKPETEMSETSTGPVTVSTKIRTHRANRHTRTLLTGSNQQRIYVDTPTSPPSTGTSTQSKTVASVGQPIESPKSRSDNQRFFFHPLTLPIRLAFGWQLSLCKRVWDGILAIDESLESFLRCMLLLDPRNRNSRH